MAYARLARLLVLLLLIAVIAYPFAQDYLQRQATSEAKEDLPELFQKAVLHYNVSTRQLSRVMPGINTSLQVSDALNLSRKLASINYRLPAEEDSSILSLTAKAARSYSYMANASAAFYRAAELNSELYRNITGMLSLLGMCRVNEALLIWNTIGDRVYELSAALREGIGDSTRVDPDSLLSDSHRRVYAEGLESAYKLYGDMSKLIELMTIIDAYKEYIEIACSKSSNGTISSPPQGLMNSINSLYNGIVGNGGGMYSYDLYSTVAAINSLLAGASQSGSQGEGIGQAGDIPSGSPGRGAGYGSPPSDD